MLRMFSYLTFIAFAVVVLSGCGVKGDPIPYVKAYPPVPENKPETVPAVVTEKNVAPIATETSTLVDVAPNAPKKKAPQKRKKGNSP